MTDCLLAWVCLALMSSALLLSLFINVVFCLLRQRHFCIDREDSWCPQSYGGQSPSEVNGHFHFNRDHTEEQDDHQGQQENPIYGNIHSDRVCEEACYEAMMEQCTRGPVKSGAPDLNYASLDLKVAKQRRRKQQQAQMPERDKLQEEEPPAPLSPPAASFLEVEPRTDASLPRGSSSPKVSDNGIYLNSQQILQGSLDWKEVRWLQGGGNREWRGAKGEEEEEGMDRQDSIEQLIEAEEVRHDGGTFIRGFSQD
ncbi:uncharacterized protein LOC143014860 [Genypterus blacodes]|uniref:uncharacterized protein LOC143014860 n=1 Tax=Genypterus blacodes TaxID=154954 RepID=UPI003F7609D0